MLPLLGAIGPAAGLIGRIFGGASQGSAQNRMAENQQALQTAQDNNQNALQRGQLQSQHALNTAGLDLQRRQFAQNEPSAQAGQALRGSILNRIQPIRMSGLPDRVASRMPQMNSIIDAIGPEARAAGALLAQRGLSGLEQGPSQFQAIEALNLPPMQVAQLKQSGLLEKLLGAGGLIGSTVGALGNLSSVDSGPYRTPDFNPSMPTPYSGMDQYGNQSNWQIPRADLLGDLNEELG
jgi:hypothetical protein